MVHDVLVHGSLFSGIGGFDLAAEWMGWENAFHCEYEEFNKRVLKYYWPNSICYGDIKQTDFSIWRGRIDILTGGFPCQPYSTAGKRKGKEDERHLWPEMLRAIREIQPTWVVGENVFGLVNWNGGMVFDEVQADLEAEGYEVQPYILPAASVNAPHKRDRVWFVAYSNNSRLQKARSEQQTAGFEQHRELDESTPNTECERFQGKFSNRKSSRRVQSESAKCNTFIDASDTHSGRQSSEKYREKESGQFAKESVSNYWENFPTQSPICNGDDGIFTKSHRITISEDRNNMDRNLVTKLCLDEGRLKVDFDTGKIYSLKQRGKEGQEIELLGSDCNGYIVHGIRYNGFKIQLRAHQIVWIAANGLYDKSVLMIDHINRNKKDNRLENLRLIDSKGNRENQTEYKGKLTDEQKDMMVWLHKEDGIPIRELAEDYGISKSRVQQIIAEHSGIYGYTFSKWRNESIKSGGNAIVPQVVYQIFKAIEAYNKLK